MRIGRVQPWCCVMCNFECMGIILIWIVLGQCPVVLAAGTGQGLFNPVALRTAKTQWSFGHSEYNRV